MVATQIIAIKTADKQIVRALFPVILLPASVIHESDQKIYPLKLPT